jgi:glycosyltransferase involved in cell wall biosynthesis
VRIVLVTSLERGGPVEQSVVLARGLTELGASVAAVCATKALADRFSAAGAEAVLIPLRPRFDPSAAARIRRFAAGAEVIHGQDRRSGLAIRVGRRPAGRPARVYTVHGLPDEYLPPPAGPVRPGLRGTLFYRGLDAALCRRCEAVVVASSALRDLLVERLGFPRERMHVIPNGVDPAPAAAGSGELVGTVSMLEPVKGLEVFLEAAAQLAAERPELSFGVFGTGSQDDVLRRRAEALGIAARVEQPGQVPAAEALGRLRVLVSSSYMENSPMSVLEAMAAGVPVVATRVGGVPEIAVDGTAELVTPGAPRELAEAIARLLDDPDRAGRQAAAARDRVRDNFSAAANAAATLALYEQLTRGRG